MTLDDDERYATTPPVEIPKSSTVIKMMIAVFFGIRLRDIEESRGAIDGSGGMV